MFSFLLIYVIKNNDYDNDDISLNDIGFTIWSGDPLFKDRIAALTRTWFQFLPEVHVYSDKINETFARAILAQTNHVNIIFHEQNVFPYHLIGSVYPDPWVTVQERHLPHMANAFKYMPNKKWYFFGDDDTYLFPESLPYYLKSQQNPLDRITGQIWFSLPHLNRFFKNENESHIFAQGGAGFFVTHNIMKTIAPYLVNCSHQASTYFFPSDIRLSFCLEKIYGNDRLLNDGIYKHSNSIVHGDRVEKSVPRSNVNDWPISYHHIVPSIIDYYYYASVSQWKDGQGNDRYVSWTHLTFFDFQFEIEDGKLMRFVWGYKIYFDITEHFQSRAMRQSGLIDSGLANYPAIIALSQLEPLFAPNDKKKISPIRYIQKYDANLTVVYNCDSNLKPGTIFMDSFIDDTLIFNVACGESHYFPITHNSTISPLLFYKEPSEDDFDF